MSKKISYKGQIPIGEQEKINLKTLNGKRGYKITEFRCISLQPGAASSELIAQVFTKDQTGVISAQVDFTDSNLLAVAYIDDPGFQVIFFDNELFNQDIYVTMNDGSGATVPGNYYIELETVALTDIQSTQLTLKNLRTIASR